MAVAVAPKDGQKTAGEPCRRRCTTPAVVITLVSILQRTLSWRMAVQARPRAAAAAMGAAAEM